MITIPASLRSDFIHIAGMSIYIALESTLHITGIRKCQDLSSHTDADGRENGLSVAPTLQPLEAIQGTSEIPLD